MNKSPPLIKTIFPISESLTPKLYITPPTVVNVFMFPFRNSDKVLKNVITENPIPGGPVVPVTPCVPAGPVAPLPVIPVGPISP
jgi:hypothetical protein